MAVCIAMGEENMRIITISREFGSGGRELGKRLADQLGFAYYDKEIILAVAEKRGMDSGYVERALEVGVAQLVPLTFRHSFYSPPMFQTVPTELLSAQKEILHKIAETGEDCIIVGRSADVILREQNPFNMFVYADMDAKIARCIERAEEGEHITPREMKQKIRKIDSGRALTKEILSGSKWGAKENYHLTVNTTGWNIKDIVPPVAEFVTRWFDSHDK